MSDETLVVYLSRRLKNKLRASSHASRRSMSSVVRRMLADTLNGERARSNGPTPAQRRVLAAMQDAGKPLTMRQIGWKLNISRVSVHYHIKPLIALGLVKMATSGCGRYEIAPEPRVEDNRTS